MAKKEKEEEKPLVSKSPLQIIRETLATDFDDKYPFLLMPVRLETRFMEAVIPDVDPGTDPHWEINDDIKEIFDDFTDISNVIKEFGGDKGLFNEDDYSTYNEKVPPLITGLKEKIDKVKDLLLPEFNKIDADRTVLNKELEVLEKITHESLRSESDKSGRFETTSQKQESDLTEINDFIQRSLDLEISEVQREIINRATRNEESLQSGGTIQGREITVEEAETRYEEECQRCTSATQETANAMKSLSEKVAGYRQNPPKDMDGLVATKTSILEQLSGIKELLFDLEIFDPADLEILTASRDTLVSELKQYGEAAETVVVNEHDKKIGAIGDMEKALSDEKTGLDESMGPLVDKVRDAKEGEMPNAVRPGHFTDKPGVGWVIEIVEAEELWLRIYPDHISVNTHEVQLTQEEIDAGILYWNMIWPHHDEKEVELGYWRTLVATYGAQRAAWIVECLEPTNLANRPGTIELTEAGIEIISRDLTDDELKDTHKYWKSIWKAKSDTKMEEKAWSKLEHKQDENAIYFINQQRPLNMHNKPDSKTVGKGGGHGFGQGKKEPEPSFPTSTELPGVIDEIIKRGYIFAEHKSPQFPVKTPKEESWMEAPRAECMPERFVVVTYDYSGARKIWVTEPVENPLYVGPNPNPTGTDPESFSRDAATESELIIGDDIKWLTDFDTAVAKGMGIKIPLVGSEKSLGFKRIIVIGTKLTADELEGQECIEELLDGHHYSNEGFAVLPQGTATNNTDEKTSGIRSFDLGEDETFAQERCGPLFNVTNDLLEKADGQWLAEALGINNEVVENITNADNQDIAEAVAMNKALFPGTAGTLLNVLLKANMLGEDTSRVDAIRDWFTTYVSGRGFIPSVRVGRHPYGILATTALNRWVDNDPGLVGNDFKFQKGVHEYTEHLDAYWQTLVDQDKIEYIDRDVSSAADPVEESKKKFLNILGLNPSSVDYYYRYGIGPGPAESFKDMLLAAQSSGIFNEATYFSPLRSVFDQIDSALDKNDLLFSLIFTSKTNFVDVEKATEGDPSDLYLGGIIDENPLSETDPVAPLTSGSAINYIRALLDRPFLEVRSQIYEGNFNAADQPKHLFYLYLRHAMLSEYFDSSMKLIDELWRPELAINQIFAFGGGSLCAVYFHNAINPLAIPAVNEFGPYPEITISNAVNASNDGTYVIWYIDPDAEFILLQRGTGSFVSESAIGPKGVVEAKYGSYLRKRVGFKGWSNFSSSKIGGGEIIGHWKQMFRSLKGYADLSPTTSVKASNYLRDNLASGAHPEAKKYIREVIDSMEKLADVPTANLERAFAEHMDLLSYRLDAWRYSLVNKRLREMREEERHGTYIGAYGWLEDLKPKLKVYAPEPLRPEGYGDKELIYDTSNQGYVHAPSINHAITAAVLRSGYTANADSDNDSTLAVNLSSARVRTALFYLEGVRNGQSMGALLGYQFERGLHDNNNLEMDKYILDIRNAYPLVAKPADVSGNVESVEANNVLDGLAFLEATREAGSYPWGITWATSTPNAAEEAALIEEVSRMADAMDAVGDLAIAESVYGASIGNTSKSNAILNAVTQGGTPPTPDIINTPRTGYNLTNRLAVCLDPAASPSIMTPRSAAEPYLNDWVIGLMDPASDLSNIRCLARYDDGAETTVEVQLLSMGIAPLDFVFLLTQELENDFGELTLRIVDYVRDTFTVADDIAVEVLYMERDSGWATTIRSFGEMIPLVTRIQELISGGRHLTAADFRIPGADPFDEDNPGSINIAEFETRVIAALETYDGSSTLDGGLKFLEAQLNALLTPAGSPALGDIDILRGYLREAASYGVPGAYPESSSDNTQPTMDRLEEQGTVALLNIQKRIEVAGGLVDYPVDAPVETKVTALIDAAKAIFGREFRVIPQFELDDQTLFNTAIGNESQLLRHVNTANDYVVEDWLNGVAHVRGRVGTYESLSLLAENFGVDLGLNAVQWPYDVDDYWLSTSYPEDEGADEEKISLVLQLYNSSLSGTYQAGLLLDEWVEVIPAKVETSGIAFHYDQPNAEAPNCMLVAVTPEFTGSWDFEDLLATLEDTLLMAKKRAVELDHVDASVASMMLPSIFSRTDGDVREVGLDPGTANNQPLFPAVNFDDGAGNIIDYDNLLSNEFAVRVRLDDIPPSS